MRFIFATFCAFCFTAFHCSAQDAGSLDGGAATNVAPIILANLQTFNPATGNTITVVTAVSDTIIVQIAPAGTLATLTIALPAGDHIGQVLRISNLQALTAVTTTSASGSVLGAPTAYPINGFSGFYWDGTNWCRLT